MFYVIGCSKCISENEIHDPRIKYEQIKGTILDVYYGKIHYFHNLENIIYINNLEKKYTKKIVLLSKRNQYNSIIYRHMDTNEEYKNINNIINEYANNGYKIIDNTGQYPFYCETCKELSNHVYFELEKNNIRYISKHICNNCKNEKGVTKLTWLDYHKIILNDSLDGVEYGDDSLNFDYYINKINDYLKIYSENNNVEVELICENCQNKTFKILAEFI